MKKKVWWLTDERTGEDVVLILDKKVTLDKAEAILKWRT